MQHAAQDAGLPEDGEESERNEVANAAKPALLHLPRPPAHNVKSAHRIPRRVQSSRSVAKAPQNFGELAVVRHKRVASAASLASVAEFKVHASALQK